MCVLAVSIFVEEEDQDRQQPVLELLLLECVPEARLPARLLFAFANDVTFRCFVNIA